MSPTPATVPVGLIRRPVAGPHTAVAIIENTGSVPVRLSTAPWTASVDGQVVPAGQSAEVEPRGLTIWVTAAEPTSVSVTNYSINDLRANAADEFRIPLELLRGKHSKDEIADFVVRYYAHEQADQ
jgi:hypothetical protein